MQSVNDIINQLQLYDIYKNKTAYQIKTVIGQPYGLKQARKAELLIELDALQSNNIVLPSDIMYEILLNLDVDELPQACIINKSNYKLCLDERFWKNKFDHDNIPFIVISDTKTLNEWILNYKKCKDKNFIDAYNVSNKLVNYMLHKKKNYIDYFIVLDINYDTIDWLPQSINNGIVKSKNQSDLSLYFNIKNSNIMFMYVPIDEETGDYGDEYVKFVENVTRQDFIIYLANLFYYFPDVAIMNEEDEDKNDIFLQYKVLRNNPKYIRTMLPEW